VKNVKNVGGLNAQNVILVDVKKQDHYQMRKEETLILRRAYTKMIAIKRNTIKDFKKGVIKITKPKSKKPYRRVICARCGKDWVKDDEGGCKSCGCRIVELLG